MAILDALLGTFVRHEYTRPRVLPARSPAWNGGRAGKVVEPDDAVRPRWSSGRIQLSRPPLYPFVLSASECRLFRIEWIWPQGRDRVGLPRYEPQWRLSDRRADFDDRGVAHYAPTNTLGCPVVPDTRSCSGCSLTGSLVRSIVRSHRRGMESLRTVRVQYRSRRIHSPSGA